jgi:putative ABC transport system permease protein
MTTIETRELIKAETVSWPKMSLRNLGAHKVRLLLTLISVVLGTAFVAGSFVFTDTLHSAFDDIITTSDQGIAVQVDANSERSAGVPIALAQSLTSVSGVRAVELQASAEVVVIAPDGKKVKSGGAPSQGGIWTPAEQRINTAPTFVSGSAPIGPDQVVINASAARSAHLTVGDQLKIVTLKDGPINVTLSGIYQIDAGTGGYVGVLFDQARALQLFTDGQHVSAVRLAAEPGVTQATLRERVAAELKAISAPTDLRARTGDAVRQSDRNDLQKALSFVNIFLLAFGGIALLVGTFIIYNTFSMIVAQRLRELALLRAIGADRGQVMWSVLTEAAVIGFVGAVIGAAVGVALAIGLHAVLDGLGLGLPGTSVVVAPRTIIVALIVGVGVTVLSATSPARRAGRIPPVAAMREQFATTTAASLRRRNIIGTAFLVLGVAASLAGFVSDSAGTAAALIGLGLLGVGGGALLLAATISGWFIGALGAVVARPFGAIGRLARTNAVRNPRRTAATAFALTLGLMLVSGIAVIGSSTKASLNTIVDNEVRADYILTGSSFGVPVDAAVRAGKVAGVASLTQIQFVQAEINGTHVEGSSVDGPLNAVMNMDVKQGGDNPGGTNMLISETQAKNRGWKLGDRVTLSSVDGGSVAETITGIYADSPLMGNWVVSGDTYRALTPKDRWVDEVALVRAVPGTDLGAVRSGLDSATDPYYVIDVQDRDQFKGTQADQVNGLLGILYGLLGLAILIAILGIVNTLALSVVERRREIGMLRAVGMQRAQVRRAIYVESALIAMFGAALGLVIGLTFGALFTRTLRASGLKTLDIPWGQAIAFFVVAGVVGVLAALWPGVRAARTSPLAAIAEQ